MQNEQPSLFTKRLIVNADDYGLTPGVTQGILAAHRRGMVTSTTAMMNRPDVEDALQEARQSCPRMGLGVHLVLTAGQSLLEPSRLPSITGANGKFLKVSELISHLDTLNYDEVQAEWQAQIDRFVKFMGRPDHLDSHHHVACFTSGLFEVMLQLAGGLNCPVRMPLGTGLHEVPGDLPPEQVRNVLETAPSLLEKYRTAYPHNFIPTFYDEGVSSSSLAEILQSLPTGVSELMTHPGLIDKDLLACSSYTLQREREVAALTDSRILSQLPEWGIELVNFSSLSNSF
jgi:chitin disaccharide deacetylase